MIKTGKFYPPGFFVFITFLLSACNNQTGENSKPDWSLTPFVKIDSANPVLTTDSLSQFTCPFAGPVRWEAKDVFNPATVLRHDSVFLLYRAEDKIGKFAGTSRIGLAWSTDGIHFTRHPEPVLFPDQDAFARWEWEGGCEDPRIVQGPLGEYYMSYTAYDGDKARLMIATSPDLFHWTKQGPAFDSTMRVEGVPAVNIWSKSGSVVCRYINGQPVAEKINGKYLMYWGDTQIFMATSDDLVRWSPVVGKDGVRIAAFGPRKGKFDSDLVEPGPPAMLTDEGILLLYNSRNDRRVGDQTMEDHTYAAGQICFSAADPAKQLYRSDTCFIRPDKPYEISGQVNQVCFIEGLVQLRGRWYLYYGTADSRIAVAVH